jgi:hypothetical protein
MIAGRDFDERDTRPRRDGGRPVAIVNEAFAKRYLGAHHPLGCYIGLSVGPLIRPDLEVVGVGQNISYRGVREEWEQAYVPLLSAEGSSFYEVAIFFESSGQP